MIEFPLKTKADIEAYDRSVRVTRAARGLPPAMEFMPRYYNVPVLLNGRDLGHREIIVREFRTASCVTWLEQWLYDGIKHEYRILEQLGRQKLIPCTCGMVLWVIPPLENIRDAQIQNAEHWHAQYECERMRRWEQRMLEEEEQRRRRPPYVIDNRRSKRWSDNPY